MSPRPATDEKRSRILRATLDLVADNGLHAAPVSKVAATAGVAAGTIYHYFASKEDLIEALYLDMKARLGELLVSLVDRSLSYPDQFRRIWRGLYDYLTARPREFAFYRLCEDTPAVSPEVRRRGEEEYSPVLALIDRGVAEGYLKDLPRPMLQTLVYGSVLSVARLGLAGDEAPEERHLEAAVRASWDAVRRHDNKETAE